MMAGRMACLSAVRYELFLEMFVSL